MRKNTLIFIYVFHERMHTHTVRLRCRFTRTLNSKGKQPPSSSRGRPRLWTLWQTAVDLLARVCRLSFGELMV